MAVRSLSQKPWSQAELDRDCFTPMPGDLGRYEEEHDWDLEDESFTRPSWSVPGGVEGSIPGRDNPGGRRRRSSKRRHWSVTGSYIQP